MEAQIVQYSPVEWRNFATLRNVGNRTCDRSPTVGIGCTVEVYVPKRQRQLQRQRHQSQPDSYFRPERKHPSPIGKYSETLLRLPSCQRPAIETNRNS